MAAGAGSPHTRIDGLDDREEAVPNLSERRLDAWTALAAEPAVRAAERAIATRSPDVLADTLAVSSATEAARRLALVLDLKERAARDPRSREAYQRAVDDLRNWAAGVYLAHRRVPHAREPVAAGRPTEESISLRRLVARPPFPGQRRRHPYFAGPPSGTPNAEPAAEPPARASLGEVDDREAEQAGGRLCLDGVSRAPSEHVEDVVALPPLSRDRRSSRRGAAAPGLRAGRRAA
jgi:hypothetical protein